MYYQHFGLSGPPFLVSPSRESFFASKSHRESLAALQWGLSDPTGLVLLTGDVGTGKTTVIRELFSQEMGAIRAVLVTNPILEFDELLSEILRDLNSSIPPGRAPKLKALEEIHGRERVVVVIDEAQKLTDESLEQLRLLSNANPGRLQLMLVGQPELLQRLASPALRQLNQRIAIRAVLNPLDERESVAYLDHRLRAVRGDARNIFSRSALRALTRLGDGIPRRINILSHNAMLLAFSRGDRRVTKNQVETAAQEFDQATPPAPVRFIIARELLRPVNAVPLALLVAWLGISAVRTALARKPVASVTSIARTEEVIARHATADVLPAPPLQKAEQPQHPQDAGIPSVASEEARAGIEPVARMAPEEPDELARRTLASPEASAEAVDQVTVRRGDTLSAIVARYRRSGGELDVTRLLAANPEITNPDVIYPGEKLRVERRTATERGMQ